jgi:hypothetical protein
MSWIEKQNTEYTIKCGDGKTYTPLWLNATQSVEYNIAEFDFRNVSGSLVKRTQPKGRRFNLEIIFQGETHLDTADNFRISANDPRVWNILHPLYGSINVHPTSLSFDNTKLNTTTITGTVIETILEDNPQATTDEKSKITEDCENTNAELCDTYAANVTPTASDINSLTNNNQSFYDKAKAWAGDATEDYTTAFNSANSAITEATSDPLNAIQKAQAVINMPAMFAVSVETRLSFMGEQFDLLISSIGNIATKNQKLQFENQGGSIITAMCLSSINPIEGDYSDRNSVVMVAEKILNYFGIFSQEIDLLQSLNGGNPNSYIPSANAIMQLTNLVNFVFANLFKIALSSKQERQLYLENDSNAILLTHRFYGLDENDENINFFIDTNNITLQEIHFIKKGRSIIYYV